MVTKMKKEATVSIPLEEWDGWNPRGRYDSGAGFGRRDWEVPEQNVSSVVKQIKKHYPNVKPKVVWHEYAGYDW